MDKNLAEEGKSTWSHHFFSFHFIWLRHEGTHLSLKSSKTEVGNLVIVLVWSELVQKRLIVVRQQNNEVHYCSKQHWNQTIVFRSPGGSRVLQHCISCETGQREDTGQWEPHISGTEAKEGRNQLLPPKRKTFFHTWAIGVLIWPTVSVRAPWSMFIEFYSAKRRNLRRWFQLCQTVGSLSR